MVNMGCIDMNTWYSRVDKPDRPDFVLFDLDPTPATTEWSKARRRGVLIDANQNGEGKTIATAYSVRPKPGAPVSTPLAWDEVNERMNPAIYTMPVVLERVREKGDVYAPMLT